MGLKGRKAASLRNAHCENLHVEVAIQTLRKDELSEKSVPRVTIKEHSQSGMTQKRITDLFKKPSHYEKFQS